MEPTGARRVLESAVSRERTRERTEAAETEKYRRARGMFSDNSASKKISVGKELARNLRARLDETND